MKLLNPKGISTVSSALLLAVVCTCSYAQVYKVVDEDGNVTYTDQPPKDGTAPMELPPLSIVEAPDYQPLARPQADEPDDEDTEMSLRQLRSHYRGFVIISPENEQSLWNPQGVIMMAWQAPHPLREGMRVRASMDGQQLAVTADRVIPITKLERGAHTLEAVLEDARGRTIVTAEPVTFFIRQPSVIINRPDSTPSGG